MNDWAGKPKEGRPYREISGGAFPCPVCGLGAGVSDSRLQGSHIRRRRQCAAKHRFTTYEIVVAKDGCATEGNARREALRAAVDRLRELQEALFEVMIL